MERQHDTEVEGLKLTWVRVGCCEIRVFVRTPGGTLIREKVFRFVDSLEHSAAVYSAEAVEGLT